jgi:ribose-phosphate pyrophosphokinase
MNDAGTLVFSTERYQYLADDLRRLGGFEAGEVERRRFPDGERYLRVDSSVAGRDVAVVGGTPTDGDVLELFDLAGALAKYGVRRLTLVIPYFGYATMERAARPGEVVVAKARARLISAIPPAAMGTRALLLDLHSEGIPYYFEGHVVAFHVYGKPVTIEAIRRLGREACQATGATEFVVASTDAGRAKWVQSLANELGAPASFVYKRRTGGRETEITAVSAQVDGRAVVIYDDMIRTGGSLVQAAQAYRAAGARSVSAVATHGVLPGDSLARIRDSGALTRVVCTDSHPRARELAPQFPDFLTVEPAAGLFVPFFRDEK